MPLAASVLELIKYFLYRESIGWNSEMSQGYLVQETVSFIF